MISPLSEHGIRSAHGIVHLISLLLKLGRYPESNFINVQGGLLRWSCGQGLPSTAGGGGLTPGQGIKIPHASWLCPNKKQTEPINMPAAQEKSWAGDARLHHRHMGTDENCKSRYEITWEKCVG